MNKLFLILFSTLITTSALSEIFIFKDCKSSEYSYEKNNYTLDLKKGLMTRNFIYDKNTFKKLRLNDISIKKVNSTTKGIIEENNLILSEISGYPTFYTQLIFNKKDGSVKIKTVLNNNEGVSLVSKCENVIKFIKET